MAKSHVNNPDEFRLEADCSSRPPRRKRRAHRADVVNEVIALVELWDADQRSSTPSARQPFASWLRAFRQAARSARSGQSNASKTLPRHDSAELSEMERLCTYILFATPSATPKLTGSYPSDGGQLPPVAGRIRLRFSDVVRVAQAQGIFADVLTSNDRMDIDRASRCRFARMLYRYHGHAFNGSVRMRAVGAGHARQYIVEQT